MLLYLDCGPNPNCTLPKAAFWRRKRWWEIPAQNSCITCSICNSCLVWTRSMKNISLSSGRVWPDNVHSRQGPFSPVQTMGHRWGIVGLDPMFWTDQTHPSFQTSVDLCDQLQYSLPADPCRFFHTHTSYQCIHWYAFVCQDLHSLKMKHAKTRSTVYTGMTNTCCDWFSCLVRTFIFIHILCSPWLL